MIGFQCPLRVISTTVAQPPRLVPETLCCNVVNTMQFMKRLRDPVRNGEVTRTVRIWKSLRVKVGNRYLLEPGHIVVDAVHPIELSDITPEIARETGFKGVVDLLKTARHGTGDQVFLIDFHYLPPEA